jgi:hypothetical protein
MLSICENLIEIDFLGKNTMAIQKDEEEVNI